MRIDLERYQAHLELRYDSGPRYRFGEVDFHQDVLDEELLRSFVDFAPGEPYEMEPVLDLQNALGGTGYFATVEVQPEPERARDLRVPVAVRLRPDERQRWEVGGGYGTDTGPRGTLAVELRRLNRAGHRARAETRVSQIERSVTTRYEIPGDPARTELWTISAGWADLDPETSESTATRIGGQFNRAIGSWRLAVGLGFERETFEIGPDSGRSELLIPEATWSRSRSDSALYPLHGHRLEARLRGGVESTISDTDFVQLRLLGRLVHALRAGRPRLLARLELGVVDSDAFRSLPPSLRFFAGGDRSVRGYGYEELTPRTADGLPIGGEVLATASVELDALLYERWDQRFGAAIFYDAGNALRSFSAGELEHGAGVGLRWLSPVGLVRADVAFALGEPGAPARFHLSIGPDL
jgi:translocation and assembly module TamA